MNDLVVINDENLPMSSKEIQKQVNLIQEVLASVMKDGEHYGTIPGCGDKKTLLKPGAEKISMAFRLRPVINPREGDVEITELGDGHRDYIVYCHIKSANGLELATGVGSCSTMESKYRYRGGSKSSTGKQVPTEYWNLKKANRLREAQDLIGGEGFSHGKIDGHWMICEVGAKQENPDIADTYNTVLKMAKKRAYVDGILSATAASDIFVQDIQDLPDDVREDIEAQAQTQNPPQETVEPIVVTDEQKQDELSDLCIYIAARDGITANQVCKALTEFKGRDDKIQFRENPMQLTGPWLEKTLVKARAEASK